MSTQIVDIVIVGAGPVGLMCAYLGRLCGLSIVIVDKSDKPLDVGRADALNARTLQLLKLVSLFDELYPLGKVCNTSSVWANGKFISRQSSWWDVLEGCLHKHFLMLGQSHLEKLLDNLLGDVDISTGADAVAGAVAGADADVVAGADIVAGADVVAGVDVGANCAPTAVKRSTSITDIELNDVGCLTTLSNGELIQSKFVIGADGSRSFVRNHFNIAFNIIKPEIIWAVIDGVLETDFPKVPEIIVFQSDTSDVAWIPREGEIDRFYIRMDTKNFTLDDVITKINCAINPHKLTFKHIDWFSQFSVKESVAEKFFVHDRIFLAGDACHIHSVNGGQGLNTGLGDAFNLMWKLNMVIKFGALQSLLQSYEDERRPVAKRVIETSGKLVRATKYSQNGTHAEDYVRLVEKHAGNITGMGIRYGSDGLAGTRIFDFDVVYGIMQNQRAYSRLPRLLRSLAMTQKPNHAKESNYTKKHRSRKEPKDVERTRLYSLLNYSAFTLLIFSDNAVTVNVPEFINVIQIFSGQKPNNYSTDDRTYINKAILVRPDAYIDSVTAVDELVIEEVIKVLLRRTLKKEYARE